MSPEQCNGSPLDGRSDLFAIGVMLWEALANDTLFKGTPSEFRPTESGRHVAPWSSRRRTK